MDVEALKRCLPFGYPYLLIDRVVERSEGEVVALKCVAANEPYFQGHFRAPYPSLMPGTMILEGMAQTAEVGIVNMEGFLAQYQQLQSAFQQLDQLLTQAAAAKIVEIAQQVAREKGFDLVLRKKDVLIYYDSSTVSDISGDVEGRLWNLF